VAIGFDLVANQDFSCSGRFSGDSVCADFPTREQSAPNPETVHRTVHVVSRRSSFGRVLLL